LEKPEYNATWLFSGRIRDEYGAKPREVAIPENDLARLSGRLLVLRNFGEKKPASCYGAGLAGGAFYGQCALVSAISILWQCGVFPPPDAGEP